MTKTKISVLLIVLFAVVTLSLNIAAITNLDRDISLALYNFFNFPLLTQFFNIISNYTLGTIFGVLICGLAIVQKKLFRLAVFFILGIVSLEIIIYVIKLIVDRIRPFIASTNIIYLGNNIVSDFGFPSGHTTLAFFLAYFMFKIVKINKNLVVLLYIIAILVGLSRIALGAHYLLDVIGGILLGTIFGMIMEQLFSQLSAKFGK